MDELVRTFTPEYVNDIKISIEEFIDLYNNGKCELLDVRVGYELDVWQLNFGLKIPADELPQRLNELPKDKTIVVACPQNNRSNMTRVYLAHKGYDARYLEEGLIKLLFYLKGGSAKKIKLQ